MHPGVPTGNLHTLSTTSHATRCMPLGRPYLLLRPNHVLLLILEYIGFYTTTTRTRTILSAHGYVTCTHNLDTRMYTEHATAHIPCTITHTHTHTHKHIHTSTLHDLHYTLTHTHTNTHTHTHTTSATHDAPTQ